MDRPQRARTKNGLAWAVRLRGISGMTWDRFPQSGAGSEVGGSGRMQSNLDDLDAVIGW